MSTVPHADDVLPADVETINLPEVSERLGIPVTRVHDLLRDGTLLAVRRAGIVMVPALFLDDDEVVRFLPGLVAVLRDGGYRDEEILRWLFEEDESLPGRPADALHGHGAREVMRRAQAMAF
ncbi:Rv2175c family DNA-binding protein [Dietzia sp. B32]|uniref:Rv2175c family DNA-binding protein n=1 Tax=Dietzia sp. B32 TaxID=2915130 RepID=UPI0021ADA78D|nr:Rv2175c family DNA-binding protein [Dietzia sp. B32]UVE95011.1 Rv2175c family DNA-binding protein [Dietzia sp. B32]